MTQTQTPQRPSAATSASKAPRAASPAPAGPSASPAPVGPSASPATAGPAAPATPALLAKAALRRLAQERQEPTPANFARAYALEGGDALAQSAPATTPAGSDDAAAAPAPAAETAVDAAPSTAGNATADSAANTAAAAGGALADLIDRIVRGVDHGGKQWTRARKRDSLQRVLGGSRSDAARLQTRLSHLVQSWQDDSPDAVVDADAGTEPQSQPGAEPDAPSGKALVPGAALQRGHETRNGSVSPPPASLLPSTSDRADLTDGWLRISDALGHTVCTALPKSGGLTVDAAAALTDMPIADLAQRIAARTQALRRGGALPEAVLEIETLCQQADRLLMHREHLLEQMNKLCHELTDSLAELAEDDSWAKGQCEAMRSVLEQGLSTRGVRSVGELLRVTREHHHTLRHDRDMARAALKSMIQRMLGEISELGATTGRFSDNVGRYASVIEGAESLESLAGVVREMVEESRAVSGLVNQTRQRLDDEHSRAEQLAGRVDELEVELRRLSAEVSTDQLTQIANRRGLAAQFEQELSRRQREGGELSMALLDIDNFKRLNDTLGHAAGDQALKSLAQAVKQALRPTDLVARFGGEEFVVMLPATPLSEAQQILTRLQRGLSGSLFLHDSQPVLVTFSAGVTEYRSGETLEAALERADAGLYEAKRTGKNRTCVA